MRGSGDSALRCLVSTYEEEVSVGPSSSEVLECIEVHSECMPHPRLLKECMAFQEWFG